MAQEFKYPAAEYLLLGKVVKAHGLRGEVKLFLYSGQPENLAGYKELVLVDKSGGLTCPLAIVASRIHGKAAIVRLASVSSRTQAEAIENRGVLLARKHLPTIGAHEFYWHQYQNKVVVDTAGREIGSVENIFTNGAQDILVIRSGIDEILIPVTESILVGETADKLIINPPPGLLELNSSFGVRKEQSPGDDI